MEAEEEALYIACVVRLVVDIGILQILLREVLGINTCYLVFRCLAHARCFLEFCGAKKKNMTM
jgi:hypothetical protein